MISLAQSDMITAEQIKNKSLADVKAVLINLEEGDEKIAVKLAQSIHALGAALFDQFAGNVPSDPGELKELSLDDTIIGLLMNHVFGESELLIGLNTRKLMVALDLYDWEDSGAEERVEVKMVKIPANYVKASLLTWLPTGEKRNFQELMEPLAAALGEHKTGFWGGLQRALKRHFAPKDKDELQTMADKIHQFYKATRMTTAKKTHLLCS